MKKEIIVQTIKETIELGKSLGSLLDLNMVVALEGDLGAGKTTFTKGIAQGLGIESLINSPTFTIMKIHQGKKTLYHMDVYRLSNVSGDDDLEEFFYRDGVAVVEWASQIDSILPNSYLKVTFTHLGDEKRYICFESNDSIYDELIERMSL